MNIGFFGGTFDPPHRGHFAVAQAALREFSLDQVLLCPAARQPLKPDAPEAPFADRLAMVRLLCEGETRLQASGIEAPRSGGGPNFTVDTLQQMGQDFGTDSRLFAIVGADSFLDIRRWRAPDRLLEIANWIVVSRPGFALHFAPLALSPAQQARVHVLDTVHMPVSATEVRARLRTGEDVSAMLPGPVLAYIREHHLYGPRVDTDLK